MFQRILIPLDGSDVAEAILPLLRQILRRTDSEVLLLQAVPIPFYPVVSVNIPLTDIEASARTYTRTLQSRWESEGARVRAIVRQGPAAEVILDVAEKENASLIALSTHGRTGLARWLLGSVAEKVIRSSQAPVLLVRSFPGGKSRSVNLVRDEIFAPEHILVPLDGSENSLEVVPYAIAMARKFGARTTLLCADEGIDVPVVQLMAERGGGLAPAPLPPRPLASDRALKRAIRMFEDAGVAVELQEPRGDPATKILELTHRQGAKLIAMTTHGRSGPSRWMLGSVTEKVLRAAEVPLLIVRSPSARR